VHQLDRAAPPWDDSTTQPMAHPPVHVPSSGSMKTSPRVGGPPDDDEEPTMKPQAVGSLPQPFQGEQEAPTLLDAKAPPAAPMLPEAEDPTPFRLPESPTPTPAQAFGAMALPLRPYVPPPFVPPAYPAGNPRTAPTVKRRVPWQLRIALICGAVGGLMFVVFVLALLARALLR
jgi:hypothetical protein